MVPFWILNIIWHQDLGDPKQDHNFDNRPCVGLGSVLLGPPKSPNAMVPCSVAS